MLLQQKERPRFTGGFEAARFTDWHVEWLVKLNPEPIYFAYDTPDDYDPLVYASKLLKEAGIIRVSKRSVRCYVLIGYPKDSISEANNRLENVCRLGIMPMAMLYDLGKGMDNLRDWKRFQREWANTTIVGSKMGSIKNMEDGKR